MKSLIVIASLLTLVSCSDSGSGSKTGSALTQEQLSQTFGSIYALRLRTGFHSSVDQEEECNGHAAKKIVANTVISSSDNTVVTKVEESGETCDGSGNIVQVNVHSIEISPKQNISSEDMKNIKSTINGQQLTLEGSNEEGNFVEILDMKTGCTIDYHTKDHPEKKMSESCEIVDVKKLDLKDDAVLMRSKENESGDFKFIKVSDLTGADIEDKIITIKNLPEYSSGADEIKYEDYITIK